MEKYGTAGQATDDGITRRMRFTCWMIEAINTHSEYAIITGFFFSTEKVVPRSAALLLKTYIVVLLESFTSVHSVINCHTKVISTIC